MKYKVIMHYPSGADEEDEAVFDTEAEAEAYGLDVCGCYSQGAEVLNMSNPGDYPLMGDEDDVEFEVIEVEE